MKPKIIVCGLGRTGYTIFCLLKHQGAAVTGISDRPMSSEYQRDIIVGELRSPNTLSHAGILTAQTLVLTSNDDSLNLAVLTYARLMNPRIKIINRLFNETLGKRLDETLPDHVSMSVSALAAPIFSFAALGDKAIGQLRLYNQTWPIQEVVIDEAHPWLGMPLSELWDNPSRMLIYYLPARDEIDLVSAVVNGKRLQIGDHLIMGSQPTTRLKKRYWWRKIIKPIANLRQYQHHVQSVAFVILLLLLMIGFSTVLYVSTNFKVSLVNAFYFSVGMITGAGGQEDVIEKASDEIKVYTAIMMIVGAGVIGICYALLNDFILGSRFKQFWDAARVPTRNHYIVCGLGGIGMEIVRQLYKQGHDVVVVEANAKNRFLHTARSLGVPVIIEDARIAGSLKAANLERADAILVTTSDDMVNVEIALTAKAISPKINLVVRSQDPQFGKASQEVFEFEAVLCASDLATHTFTAAALGGKILGNGMTDDLLWVAVATLITPNHPFCKRTVKDTAMEADYVPLYIERNNCTVHSWNLLEILLLPGDVLYLTIPATKLEQLWRNTNDSVEQFINNGKTEREKSLEF
ncbi:potassium channel protein [Aphanothece hegewaldii CCALA 016]|uniref:Potassium channel protein n=1 Tax=Aphanothece hegewaldii CCALA 016 TaxID=2107694 RepID=A0A2T1LZX3_9CHRO|nr:NAD-binding protein [Aphanothece hegewaldii]PSF37971.1 potassium channel protein [Aphanothece hegewaldii CCALA 016]